MPKKLIQGLLVGLGASGVALGLWFVGWLTTWEGVAWNTRVRLFAPYETPSSKVKVILIDQASLDWGRRENYWPWPWPREVYGPILDFCRRSGARSVSFDMLYTESSIQGVADDEAFGDAIRRTSNFVGTLVLGKDVGLTTNWPPDMPRPGWKLDGMEDWLTRINRGRLIDPTALFPIPEIGTNISLLSNVMDVPDPDGIFRRIALFRIFDGEVVPSMALAAWLAGRNEAEKKWPLRIEKGGLYIGDRRLPIDRGGRAILHFKGEKGFHETYSAAAVIQSELRLQAGEEPVIKDPDVFKDCHVLLGPSAPALLDLRSTPLSKVSPGVELHATALDNLLSMFFFRRASRDMTVGITMLLSLLAAMVVTMSRRVWQSVLAFAIFLPLPALVGLGAYRMGIWFPIMAGEVGVALALVGAVVVNYATEGRQKAFIKRAFKHYLSPDVIEQIIEDPSQLKLGGEKRELTIFFSDLQGFSSFSEKLDPPTLTKLLNDYLSDMTDIILEEGGTLDKYEGDAIIAFWNAPLAQPDHAMRACRAALRCQRQLTARREEFQQRTGAVLKMRIGMNTGEVVVGNMGSSNRFNYTILGDAANLASRLEGANKAFGTYMMVSEATWTKLNGQFPGRELGRIRVVGRKTPVRVFEPATLPGEALPDGYGEFEQALRHCDEGRWKDALAILERFESEPAAKTYAEKCRALIRDSSLSWDGIWNLTEK